MQTITDYFVQKLYPTHNNIVVAVYIYITIKKKQLLHVEYIKLTR